MRSKSAEPMAPRSTPSAMPATARSPRYMSVELLVRARVTVIDGEVEEVTQADFAEVS